jgi:hypothetical protein
MNSKVTIHAHFVPASDFDDVLNGLAKLGYRNLPDLPSDSAGVKFRMKHLMSPTRHLYVYRDYKAFYIFNVPADHYEGKDYSPEELYGRHVITFS